MLVTFGPGVGFRVGPGVDNVGPGVGEVGASVGDAVNDTQDPFTHLQKSG